MPLLRKQIFEKQVVPDFLRDDEEVFYCEITNEIFRDYHDFSERMFLCNSMVWTCSMTGKSNLTYQEAVESEEHAIQCLKEFPNEIKLPILYLATLTKRTSFGDMAEDVFVYMKDRYFVGENIEACFTTNKWKDCHIISVIAPDAPQYKQELQANGSKSPSERHFIPSAGLYKYEIEHLNPHDNDISEIMIVDSTQLRRKKAHYSRDKSKLFLKQNVEQDSRGIFVIKLDALEKYNVKNIMWEMIFDGPMPNFQSSKNFDKALNGKKKQRQETMAKYLKKNGLVMKKEGEENNKGEGNKEKAREKGNLLLQQMREREEEFKKLKQLNDEQKALVRQQKKQENLKLARNLKNWLRPKEDLELEDHVKLPIPTPVKCKVPNRNFGDVLAVLEFVHCFPKLLSTKDFFPGGFSLEVMERAVTEQEVAGPLTDLIQMLLVAIFNCQEEESNSYNTITESLKEINEKTLSTTPSLKEGTHLATLASKWSDNYQGMPITRLPLYSLTVSEILRLHLLSSGARIRDSGARWRYAQRGGYTNEDDPGLHLRLHQAHILKALAVHNVVELSISDKMKIIHCLMNQILSYADVRDVLEEHIENVRATKQKLRTMRTEERRREMEVVAQKTRLKKEMAEDPEGLKSALEKLEAANEKKQMETRKKIEKMTKSVNEGQVLLGRDRAYRKYLKLASVPGVFVNWEDELAGTCLEKATVQYPGLADAGKSQIMTHIKTLYDSPTKKDNSTSNSPGKRDNSPPKSPKKVNGIRKSLAGTDTETLIDLLLCTTDKENCPVHSETNAKHSWSFFHDKGQIECLIKALNKRGYREGELKEALECELEQLLNLVARTPVAVLNPEVKIEQSEEEEMTSRNNGANKKKDRYEDANLGYPLEMRAEQVLENALIENILEMEEKVTAGGLGALMIKDRDKWRNCLHNKNYEEFETLRKIQFTNNDKGNKQLKLKKAEEDRSRSSTPEAPDRKEYQDPGRFLGVTLDSEGQASETETSEDIVLRQSDNTKRAIRCLANALDHIAEAVDSQYLKRPLGQGDIKRNTKQKEKDKYDVLDNWQQSLLASTSYSQVFLHYGTLDSCVMWSRSALLARCQTCRRQKDSENMLLCDNCNLGHHMYCLKPKLRAVPRGDWFCDKCKKEKEKEEKLLSPEPVKRRRRIFDEEEEEPDSGNEDEEGGEEEEESSESEETSEEEEEDDDEEVNLELCKTCGSGGETVQCEKCESNFHKECIEPPLRRLPRAPWTCPSCSRKRKNPKNRDNYQENGYDSDYGVDNLAGFSYNQRRCAVKASHKIHAFAKALRFTDTDSLLLDSDNDEDSDSKVFNTRSHRREDKRDDLPLHNAALQELLSDVMKQDTAWPFIRPVHKVDVPDYYDVIAHPMDFGTIKYKLNMGEYRTDSQLMKDVVLVFENCNTYNSSSDEVYECGVKLLEYFSKKARIVGISVPPELQEEDTIRHPKAKKKRTK